MTQWAKSKRLRQVDQLTGRVVSSGIAIPGAGSPNRCKSRPATTPSRAHSASMAIDKAGLDLSSGVLASHRKL